MFIVIDWIDWSWKKTQVELLASKLKKNWNTIKILDYPRYNNKSAFAVEKYLKWKYWNNISAKQASIFYAIDRFDDSFDYNINKYDYIISNRYVSSSMIHQWWKIKDWKERREFIIWLKNLEYDIFWITKPDKTIFLNISLQTSLDLMKSRWKNLDLHESDINHMKSARDMALQLVKEENWIKIDCEKNGKLLLKDTINNMILKYIF